MLKRQQWGKKELKKGKSNHISFNLIMYFYIYRIALKQHWTEQVDEKIKREYVERLFNWANLYIHFIYLVSYNIFCQQQIGVLIL